MFSQFQRRKSRHSHQAAATAPRVRPMRSIANRLNPIRLCLPRPARKPPEDGGTGRRRGLAPDAETKKAGSPYFASILHLAAALEDRAARETRNPGRQPGPVTGPGGRNPFGSAHRPARTAASTSSFLLCRTSADPVFEDTESGRYSSGLLLVISVARTGERPPRRRSRGSTATRRPLPAGGRLCRSPKSGMPLPTQARR